MTEVRLGIDVACRAEHLASLADDRGELGWSAWRFRTTPADLEAHRTRDCGWNAPDRSESETW
ncbi:MAG: hypothetical protein ACRDVL_00295 [Acidimicrobiia bacterium]